MGTEAAVPAVDRVLVHRLAAFGVSNRDLNNSMFFYYFIMMSVLVTLVLLYFTFQRSVHHSIVEESFPP